MDVLIRPMEFSEAVAKVKNRIPVGSKLDTEGWSKQDLAIRENAFFSAKVEEARVLSELQSKVLGSATKAEFVAKTRRWLLDNGFERATNQQDLRQLASTRRLELIFEHNTEAARGYGWWKQGQDPDVLDAFPAQEFLRVESRNEPRMDWERRWVAAGGKVYGGRMIALKSDPVWRGLSRFGTPWPPFDFSSGMGVEDVTREEAEDLGLLQPDEPVTGDEKDFNEAVERSAAKLTPEARGWLERQIEGLGKIDGNKVVMTPKPGGFGSPQRVDGDWQPKETVVGKDNSLEGLSASAKRRIGKAETEIAAQPAEVGLIFDQSGRVATRLQGKGSFIEVSSEAAAKLKGAVFSHNHPVAAPPSVMDVVNACRFGLSELRVVHRDWVWVLKPSAGGVFPPEARTTQLIQTWLRTLSDVPTTQEMHDWLVANAPGLGLNYIVKGRA